MGQERGLFLFDPRNFTNYWPTTNFSDYKTALLGRYSRAVSVAAWDVDPARGFVLTATPNTRRGIQTAPFDHAEIMLRLEEFNSTDPRPSSITYIGTLTLAPNHNPNPNQP